MYWAKMDMRQTLLELGRKISFVVDLMLFKNRNKSSQSD
jgi:hypothetical protein